MSTKSYQKNKSNLNYRLIIELEGIDGSRHFLFEKQFYARWLRLQNEYLKQQNSEPSLEAVTDFCHSCGLEMCKEDFDKIDIIGNLIERKYVSVGKTFLVREHQPVRRGVQTWC